MGGLQFILKLLIHQRKSSSLNLPFYCPVMPVILKLGTLIFMELLNEVGRAAERQEKIAD